MNSTKQILKIAAASTKWGRIAARRGGGYCRSYEPGGWAWQNAVGRATAMVERREVITRRGYAGYVEGFAPDGREFCRGGIGPL